MSENKRSEAEDHTTKKLNEDGVGGTIGAKDTFEPEESEVHDSQVDEKD